MYQGFRDVPNLEVHSIFDSQSGGLTFIFKGKLLKKYGNSWNKEKNMINQTI